MRAGAEPVSSQSTIEQDTIRLLSPDLGQPASWEYTNPTVSFGSTPAVPWRSRERRVSAHPHRCRTPRRRSLHNPICRPSSRCIAGRDLRPGKAPESLELFARARQRPGWLPGMGRRGQERPVAAAANSYPCCGCAGAGAPPVHTVGCRLAEVIQPPIAGLKVENDRPQQTGGQLCARSRELNTGGQPSRNPEKPRFFEPGCSDEPDDGAWLRRSFVIHRLSRNPTTAPDGTADDL
jgi:hypothetical protein